MTTKQTILIILACSFIALVIELVGFALNRIEEKIKTDVGDALQIVLQNGALIYHCIAVWLNTYQ